MFDEQDEELDEVSPHHRAGTTHIIDDGCDWTAWLKWNMNSRRRISEGRFELPPARPQVSAPSIQQKRGKHARN